MRKILITGICGLFLFGQPDKARADTLYLYDLTTFKEQFGNDVRPGDSIIVQFSDCKPEDRATSKAKCKLGKGKQDLHLLLKSNEFDEVLKKKTNQELVCDLIKLDVESATCSTQGKKKQNDETSEEVKNSSKLWAYEQKVMADLKSRSNKNAPYWLKDLSSETAFKRRSLELVSKIPTLKGVNDFPFCIAILMNHSRAGKVATMYCLGNATQDGYNYFCNEVTINLGTGHRDIAENPIDTKKCDLESGYRLLRVGGSSFMMPLEQEVFQGGFDGELGIYVYNDKFGAVKKWLEDRGPVNKPKTQRETGVSRVKYAIAKVAEQKHLLESYTSVDQIKYALGELSKKIGVAQAEIETLKKSQKLKKDELLELDGAQTALRLEDVISKIRVLSIDSKKEEAVMLIEQNRHFLDKQKSGTADEMINTVRSWKQ